VALGCGTSKLLVSLALAALVLVPLAEIVLRKVFQSGISGATAFEQHLTLLVGLLGGALAAREGRLLTLSTLVDLLTGRGRAIARVFSGACAAGISVFLCVAAAQLVQTEKEAGKILAYGIPVWTLQAVMPVSFGMIALRILWRAAERWRGRLAALLLAGGVVWAGLQPPTAPDTLVLPALAALLLAAVLGAPIFILLGGAALILFWGQDLPTAAIALTHYSMVTNPTLPTVPLFTLAGYFLAEGGASKRLVRVFQALFGQFRGGPAIVTVLACAFFTSFTGASGVTILALGGLLMPVLMGAGYTERSTLGLLTGSGGLGLLFPPSLPLILYAIVASLNKAGGVTIEKCFSAALARGCYWSPWPPGWAFAWARKKKPTDPRSTAPKRAARFGTPNGNCCSPVWRWSRCSAGSPRRSRRPRSRRCMRSWWKPSSTTTLSGRERSAASWRTVVCWWVACCSSWAWRWGSAIT
jgi:TRAP-type C4-dicarboxylate transport system permease small subunit